MTTAVILGGAGLVGTPVARALVESGWQVTVTGRRPDRLPTDLAERGVRYVRSDRTDPADLAQILGAGADLVVDCACYTADQAALLEPHSADLGSLVFVSSKAVYVDARGRHSNSDEPPDFGGPVAETCATLPPAAAPYDSREGYGAHKAAAEQAVLSLGLPTTVLRPSRVHGVGADRAREWVFVRRVLDGRRVVLLAGRGRGANHPTAAANLGELIAFCAERPGDRVLNCADPDAPDGLAIARAVAQHLGHEWEEVLVNDDGPTGLGAHPWDTRPPFLLDTSAAGRLGFVPRGTYGETVGPAIDDLVGRAASRPARDDPYFARYFDYDREDAWLRSR